MKMNTRIYILVAALLLIAAGANAQSKVATTISVKVYNASYMKSGDDADVVVTMTPEDFNGIATISATQEGGLAKTYDVAVVNGEGCYAVNNLAEGAYSITASFAGDDVYAASETATAYNLYVPKITTGLDISLDHESINVGEKATVGITLNNTGCTNKEGGVTAITPVQLHMNAVVSIKVNSFNGEGTSVAIVDGKGTYDLIGLEAGTYVIDVVYAGDDNYVNSSTNGNNTLTLTVNKIPVTSLSVADMSAINAGEDAIVDVAMMPNNINAAAKLVVDEQEYPFGIVNGLGKCLVPNVKAGTHNVKAVLDDYKYSGGSDVKQLIVNGTDPLTVEKNAEVTVKLDTESDAFVKLTVDGNDYYVAVKNGEGRFTAPQMTAGSNNIKAALAADNQYVGKTVDEAAKIQCVPGISYSFADGQEWMTWCDEWGWAKPDGVKAYTISGVSDDAISVEEITDGVIPSHTPLLLQKTGDALIPTSVKAAAGTDDLVSASGSGFTFWGNTTDEIINSGNYYTAGKSYVLYKGTFLKVDTDNGIAHNRCLLTLSSPSATRSLSIGGDGTTGIVNIEHGTLSIEHSADAWYSLDGRKLVGKPAKKGVYIHNSEKVVVR